MRHTFLRTLRAAVASGPYWIATLDGSSADFGNGIAIDSSGNVYVTGYTSSEGAGSNDILIAKYDSTGAIQWQRSLGDTGSDAGYAIAVDASANVYVVGIATISASVDAVIAKYNSTGAIQWQRSLTVSGQADYAYGIALDSSANVYVTGNAQGIASSGTDIFLVKYNSSGTLQWQRALGGSSSETGYSVAVDASGNAFVVGQSGSTGGAGGSDIFITKYNTSGTIQWQRSLGGTSNDEGRGVAVDSSGNVYVTGYTSSEGAGSSDLLIAKYDSTGAIQWQRSLGGTGSENGLGIAVDASANVYVVGTSSSSGGAGSVDILIAKYDTSGTILWQRSLGSTASESNQCGIAVDGAGTVYIAGYTNIATGGQVLLAKLPGDGSRTGTYGNLTYAVRTLTDAARSLTDSSRSLTEKAASLTDASTSLTDAARTLTSSTTTI